MKVGYEQIFVGREGTGSPFHHAAVYNMFYMVDGKKTWWFIDPYDSFLAYPMAVLGKAAGALLCLWPNEYNKEVGKLLIIFFHSFSSVTLTTISPMARRSLCFSSVQCILLLSTLGTCSSTHHGGGTASRSRASNKLSFFQYKIHTYST